VNQVTKNSRIGNRPWAYFFSADTSILFYNVAQGAVIFAQINVVSKVHVAADFLSVIGGFSLKNRPST
jgi:hypothetical protein